MHMSRMIDWPRAAMAAVLTATSVGAAAHVEYYDLNQGVQVRDLTAAGRAVSTGQYGANPVFSGPGATGLVTTSNRPLINATSWTAANQITTTVGAFSNVAFSAALSTATVRVDDVTDNGWGAGTRAILGDSHRVDFFNFRLTERSTVTIDWVVSDDFGNFFDGAFSLYAGVLAYQGHDNALDQLNPKTGFPPSRVQNALDAGGVVDAQGIASAFRNTRTNTVDYAGQFNAVNDWGQSSSSGHWSNVDFLAAVNGNNPAAGFASNAAGTRETLVIDLDAGNYTIAASGALGAVGFGPVSASFGLSGLNGQLDFRAQAVVTTVPLPAPGLLLGGALTLLAASRRRACRAA